MVGKEPGVHLPIFALLGGAVGGLGRLEGIGVKLLNWKIPEDVLDLARLDVLLLDLGQRLTDVPGAERSLVVGEIDDRHLRGFFAPEGIIIDADDDVFGLWRWDRPYSLQDGLNLL